MDEVILTVLYPGKLPSYMVPVGKTLFLKTNMLYQAHCRVSFGKKRQ